MEFIGDFARRRLRPALHYFAVIFKVVQITAAFPAWPNEIAHDRSRSPMVIMTRIACVTTATATISGRLSVANINTAINWNADEDMHRYACCTRWTMRTSVSFPTRNRGSCGNLMIGRCVTSFRSDVTWAPERDVTFLPSFFRCAENVCSTIMLLHNRRQSRTVCV